MRSPGRKRLDLYPTEEQKATIKRRASATCNPRTGKPYSMHEYCIAMCVDGKLPKHTK